jgi:hypothetical protein
MSSPPVKEGDPFHTMAARKMCKMLELVSKTVDVICLQIIFETLNHLNANHARNCLQNITRIRTRLDSPLTKFAAPVETRRNMYALRATKTSDSSPALFWNYCKHMTELIEVW